MSNSRLSRQADFCRVMAEKVCINAHTYGDSTQTTAGYEFDRSSGISKTQIRDDIRRLRRELLELDRLVSE